MTQAERRKYLISELLNEQLCYRDIEIPKDENKQKQLLRALFNVRMPATVNDIFLQIQDEYLQAEIAKKGITDYKTLTPVENCIYLWQGDITTLKCDAIVNAANSALLGCFCPNHGCIDNVIHTFAGMQLRAACADMMEKQGHEEETGKAKITPAYNLPSRYVIHTVGPIVSGKLTAQDEELLSSCYRSCLERAKQNDVKSIAFCCISTGEFHFPNDRAAEIAVDTVRQYKGDVDVIFNVFKRLDYEIYRELLG